MTKKFTFIASFIFVFSYHSTVAQEYLGSWALDWSQALNDDENLNSKVADSLKSVNMSSEKNPIWVLGKDSLKVYQNGSMISAAEINWTRTDRFEIVDGNKRKNYNYYINELEDGKIKMSTGHSDAEIYLRRL